MARHPTPPAEPRRVSDPDTSGDPPLYESMFMPPGKPAPRPDTYGTGITESAAVRIGGFPKRRSTDDGERRHD